MKQLISFSKPPQEEYKGRRIMADPGVHRPTAEAITREVPAGARVLEIGAGAGAFSLRLHDLGYDVVAVDIDGEKFDAPGVNFQIVDESESLTKRFGNGGFDAVVAMEVIEHVSSTRDFLREIYLLLKPGGCVFITTPNISSLYSRIVFLKEGRFYHFQGRDSWNMGHINPVPYFVFEQFSDEIGYNLEQREELGFMPVIDWSRFTMRQLFTAIPRLAFYAFMNGPGPLDGNILLYVLRKSDDNDAIAE